jgi:hypothetical protein
MQLIISIRLPLIAPEGYITSDSIFIIPRNISNKVNSKIFFSTTSNLLCVNRLIRGSSIAEYASFIYPSTGLRLNFNSRKAQPSYKDCLLLQLLSYSCWSKKTLGFFSTRRPIIVNLIFYVLSVVFIYYKFVLHFPKVIIAKSLSANPKPPQNTNTFPPLPLSRHPQTHN